MIFVLKWEKMTCGLPYENNQFLTRHNENICVGLDGLFILEPAEVRRGETRNLTGQRDEVVHHHREVFMSRTNDTWRNCKSAHMYIKCELRQYERHMFKFLVVCKSNKQMILLSKKWSLLKSLVTSLNTCPSGVFLIERVSQFSK